MKRFESENWGIIFEEHKAPLWLTLAITYSGAIYIGIAQADDEQQAIKIANDGIEEIGYETAIAIMSALSEAQMFEDMGDVLNKVDIE